LNGSATDQPLTSFYEAMKLQQVGLIRVVSFGEDSENGKLVIKFEQRNASSLKYS